MSEKDLDDFVLGVIESASAQGEPLQYAVGPMADRRVKRMFYVHNLVAPKDKLCGSINRLVERGAIRKVPTGDSISSMGSNSSTSYPVVELLAI
ncbi:MAG TPA: hypothetical protein VGE13_02825 [Candidatus Saccharimonadales bacterium]